MADRRDSLVPSHLYRSAALSLLPRTAAVWSPAAAAGAVAPALYDPFGRFRPYTAKKNAGSSGFSGGSRVGAAAAAVAPAGGSNFMIPSPAEPGKIVMYSKEFYTACTIGGILSCGLTHTGVTPMDVVKCNLQVGGVL